MARQLKPQRTNTATQNDIRRAISSVDSLIVNVEELKEWKAELEASHNDENSEVIAAFEKQFENLFSRLNKLEAKIKDLDKKVSGKSATASPLKASTLVTPTVDNTDDGDTNVE